MLRYGSMLRHKWSLAISLALLTGLLPLFVYGKPASGAGALPEGFTQTTFIGDPTNPLTDPTAMEFAPDGRLFVAEQGGKLRVVKDGQLLAEPFVDTSDRVDERGERGLLGVAFDPAFETGSPYVYVYYTHRATDTTPPHNLVTRFTANGDVAAEGSETTIFRLPGLKEFNHNGGAIHFGGDGKLYVAVGDNRREKAAQSLNSLFGKMLRINKDGSIPEDNPFFDQTNGDNRAIWARGLRNPFTFAVQPGTGLIYINDVGEQRWEEINEGEGSANYGWPRVEGPRKSRFTEPIFAYQHGPGENTGCAITGGAFYNPRWTRAPRSRQGTKATTSSRTSAPAGSGNTTPLPIWRKPSRVARVKGP